MKGRRMRNVKSERERQRLMEAIRMADAKVGSSGAAPLDNAIPTFNEGGTTRVTASGARVDKRGMRENMDGVIVRRGDGGQKTELRTGGYAGAPMATVDRAGSPRRLRPSGAVGEQYKDREDLADVIVRRGDGGQKVEILAGPWAGSPAVMVKRAGAHARVPALLNNGDLVTVEEDPGWRYRHREWVKVTRGGREPCTGYVMKSHLDLVTIAQHPRPWQHTTEKPPLLPNRKFQREEIIKDTRGYPTRNLQWQWGGKTLECPVKLTDARDTADGDVVAAPPTYHDKRAAGDLISGFYPYAPPTSVSVLPR
eukprot:TRINITY_DN22068_c0_g1_i1.p2 TRINITY_DN22068_c0_g1~~TRINITY_DN22068_c0_g1_i1.p2  ORF type:complete len:310 (+),score=105.34 TRINITY_DN22068_c0_g1_i1:53-982(+)